MSESAMPSDDGELEPVRIPDPHLEEIEASVRRLVEQSAQQAQQLDHIASAPAPSGSPFAAFGMPGLGGSPAAAPPEPPDSGTRRGGTGRRSRRPLGLGRRLPPPGLRGGGHHRGTLVPAVAGTRRRRGLAPRPVARLPAAQGPRSRALRAVRVAPGLPHPRRRRDPRAGRTAVGLHDLPDRPAHRLLPGPPPSVRSETAATADDAGTAEPGEPTP